MEINALNQQNIDRVLTFLDSRSFTFVHGDYHGKQMFFPGEQGGHFAVIDWQFPFVAQGPWDFARMLGMCADSEHRVAREHELLQRYHQSLCDQGVANYSYDEMLVDFRFGLVVSQMIMSIATKDTDISILARECDELGLDWRDVTFERTARAIDDWDALDLIKSL